MERSGQKKTIYHPNGEKYAEGVLVEGKEHGLWTYWFESGEKMAIGGFVYGKKHGPSTEWYENGQKAGEGEWKDDQQEGAWTYWHPNGQLMAKANFKQGMRNGEWEEWHENGEKKFELLYENDQILKCEAWDESGRSMGNVDIQESSFEAPGAELSVDRGAVEGVIEGLGGRLPAEDDEGTELERFEHPGGEDSQGFWLHVVLFILGLAVGLALTAVLVLYVNPLYGLVVLGGIGYAANHFTFRTFDMFVAFTVLLVFGLIGVHYRSYFLFLPGILVAVFLGVLFSSFAKYSE